MHGEVPPQAHCLRGACPLTTSLKKSGSCSAQLARKASQCDSAERTLNLCATLVSASASSGPTTGAMLYTKSRKMRASAELCTRPACERGQRLHGSTVMHVRGPPRSHACVATLIALPHACTESSVTLAEAVRDTTKRHLQSGSGTRSFLSGPVSLGALSNRQQNTSDFRESTCLRVGHTHTHTVSTNGLIASHSAAKVTKQHQQHLCVGSSSPLSKMRSTSAMSLNTGGVSFR